MRVSSFADRHNEHPRVRVQVVQIFADAQHAVVVLDIALKRGRHAALSQRVQKDLARQRPHIGSRCRWRCVALLVG